MRIKIISFFILVFILFGFVPGVFAQSNKAKSDAAKKARARTDSISKARKHKLDSISKARAHRLDSISKARAHILDSTKKARAHALDSARAARMERADSIKAVREHRIDSIAKVRKKRTDSLAAIRKHKESKKYKDSVAKVRADKIKAAADARKERMDSLAAIRKHITDSTNQVRQERTDSIKQVQKARTDSLARIAKYKASKRYKDSVTLVRRHRLDSIKTVQKDYRDSVASIRKHLLDSARLVRTKKLDSAKMARKMHTDSLATARKAKMDSLTKKREEKSKVAKVKEKKKQEQIKMQLELKLKQKREEWSNETMLKKRWSPKRKLFQNSFTHYNYYYNANRKMEEARMNMRRANKDNYDSLIGLFPFDPNKDSSLLAADMDSIVHKVSVGIQIHDPRIKWGNDMYLLLGQAYYYKGNYENASTAFRYIIANDQKTNSKNSKGRSYSRPRGAASIIDKKKKSKLAFWQHKSVHNDAILWLARTYTTAGQIENGESVLSLLEYDASLPENLVGKLAVEKAFAYLKDGNYPEASKQLSIATDDTHLPSWLRVRIAFLNGQLLHNTGSYMEAAESFEEVLTYFPKIEMDFYARKYIASNKLLAGSDIEVATIPLKKILKDGKYVNYYDQVYFVLGQLSASAGKNDLAINYFIKSTTTPKASRKQKAISFAALGDAYYAKGAYAGAKGAYDSASKYAGNSKSKALVAARQRSSGLSEISGPANTIRNIDSMLDLASMSKREQQQVARRYLRGLERERQDSINNATTAGATALAAEAAENDLGGGATNSWYFSNPTLMSQGSADFKRKWGSRPLTDNWRRASGAPLTSGSKNGGAASGEEEEETIATTQNGLPTEESLLSKIPNSPQQKELSYKIQQKAYILLAKAYIKQLEDYDQALSTLDTLCARYPAHSQKEEELFLRYQIAVKQGKLDKAQGYSAELLSKFPTSQYAKLLQPGKSESKPTDEHITEAAAYFDETYDLLMRHQYTEAQMRAELAVKKYDNPLYHKRFEVLNAMAYAGTGNFVMADSTITQFIRANPNDSLTDWAKSVKKYIAEVRNGGKPSWYKEGPYIPRSKPKVKAPDAVKPAELPPPPPAVPDAPAFYSYAADSPHYCIAVLPGLDARTAPLKKAVTGFDSAKYAGAGLELLLDFYKMKESVFIVKGFQDAAAAKKYMTDLAGSASFEGYKAGEVSMFVISANNYKKMFADKSSESYAPFYSAYYTR